MLLAITTLTKIFLGLVAVLGVATAVNETLIWRNSSKGTFKRRKNKGAVAESAAYMLPAGETGLPISLNPDEEEEEIERVSGIFQGVLASNSSILRRRKDSSPNALPQSQAVSPVGLRGVFADSQPVWAESERLSPAKRAQAKREESSRRKNTRSEGRQAEGAASTGKVTALSAAEQEPQSFRIPLRRDPSIRIFDNSIDY